MSATRAAAEPRRLPDGRPDMEQPDVNGWRLSFSPADGRFHVEDRDGRTARTFADFRAAVRWARQHALTPMSRHRAAADLSDAGDPGDRARRVSGDPGRAARRRTGHRRRGG